jgi:hypothetical protein
MAYNPFNPFATQDGFTNMMAPWGGGTSQQYAQVAAQPATTAVSQPAAFSNTYGSLYDSYNKGYGSYNQGLASLGNTYAQNYGAMAGGVGQLANALGNTWNNAQANNPYASQPEVARQTAIANLGTAAMGSYGGIASTGLNAWAQNQNGYQKAMSDMVGSGQGALSGLGQSRNAALGSLGGAMAKYGVGSEVAAALPGLMAGINGSEGGGASAGGSMGGGGMGGRGYGAIAGLQDSVMDRGDSRQMERGLAAGINSLNYDQSLARNYPREQIRESYGDLMNMNRMNLDESRRGMDQFYANYGPYQGSQYRPGQAIPTGSLLDALAGGYTDSASRIGSTQQAMQSGWKDNLEQYGKARGDVGSLYSGSVGKLDMWKSPLERLQDSWAMADANRERRSQDEMSQQAFFYNRNFNPAAGSGAPRRMGR